MIGPSRRARPALLVACALLAACAQQAGGSSEGPVEAQPAAEGTVVIQGQGGSVEVPVEIADTPEEQTVGLSGRPELASDAGMVFLVEEPVVTSFWMKDTLIPLSIAFWDETGRIHTILDMNTCPDDSCPSYFARRPWAGALEVNQGFFSERGVEVGDLARVER